MNPKPDLFYPLNEFYEQSGLPLPSIEQVDGSDVPRPYQDLLVHERDMTPTLEAAYGQPIELRVLRHSLRENLLSREILLTAQGTGKTVEFGAIKIYLEHFPAGAKSLVLEMKQPLGAILRSQKVAHVSRPAAYFKVQADATIQNALQLANSALLYGRQNVILDSREHTLARVLEILAPRAD